MALINQSNQIKTLSVSRVSIPIRHNGFSLVELVVVIVLLAIISVSMAGFYRDTTEQYLQSEANINMSMRARLSMEQIGRRLREAVPNSVRVNGANSCVEFIPIDKGTRYISLPTTSPSTVITAVHDGTALPSLASPLYVMVIPLNTNEAYNSAVGHFAQVASFGVPAANQVQVNLVAATRFNRRSPQQRMFYVRQPNSYCFDSNNLNHYQSYGFNTSQPAIGAMGAASLLLNELSMTSTFTFTPGALNRNSILMINLTVAGRKESVNLEHEVHVRNVP